jgi:hypothetical protein
MDGTLACPVRDLTRGSVHTSAEPVRDEGRAFGRVARRAVDGGGEMVRVMAGLLAGLVRAAARGTL